MASRKNNKNMYEIGQVLYIIGNGVIIPVQVVEEVVKKTLDGTHTVYNVLTKQSESDSGKTVELQSLAAPSSVFKQPAEVVAELISRATSNINTLTQDAVSNARLWYGPSQQKDDARVTHEDPASHEELPRGFAKVTMPDGEVVMIKESVK